MKKSTNLIKLNQNDFILFALEDVLPSMGILITIRFKTSHSVSRIKEAVRFVMATYPRLRSTIEPTLFSYRMRIHDNSDAKVDVLFNDAFKVRENLVYNSEEYIEYRRSLLNEPFSLEQGLPIKIRYIPDNTSPVLLLSIHHVAGDGTSWGHALDTLLAYLNDKRPSPVPLDNSSLTPAFIKKPYYTIPNQLMDSFKAEQEDIQKLKGHRIINPSRGPVDYFSPVDMHHHIITKDEKTILQKAKTLGCSVYALLLAALTMAVTRETDRTGDDVVCIIFSIDLRSFFDKHKPIFGNYAGAFRIVNPIKECDTPKTLIGNINAQIMKHIYQYKKKNKLYPMFMKKLSTVIGKKNYARAVRTAKKRGAIPMTYAVSVLGNLDNVNKHGQKAQAAEAIGTIAHQGLLLTLSSINGNIITNFSFPEAEFSREEIMDHVTYFEKSLERILEL